MQKNRTNGFKLVGKVGQGFTLIEMLVVISLIGILAALALVSFSASQKQARDTIRKSDMKQYQTALEQYGNLTTGLFPSYITATIASTNLCATLNTKLSPAISCSEDPKVPSDATYNTYKYISDGTGSGTTTAVKYVLWAKIENSSTTKYWVVCSTGKVGESTTQPSSQAIPGTCPI